MLNIDLRNKVAIVTGATSGIGAGVALMLAKAGCNIVGCSRQPSDSPAARSFLKMAEELRVKALYVQANVIIPDSVQNLVDETIEHFNGIDIVISNAGYNIFKGLNKCTLENWQENMNVNLQSHWLVGKACKPFLDKSENGTIIIMTSNHAFASIPGCFPYNVAKAGLTGLVNAMAIEWSPLIRTIGLAPGFIETEGGNKWFDTFPDPELERQRSIKRHPAGKLGSVEEIGAFCAFLSSDFARFTTGVTYIIDGGRSALMQDE